ncbi:MAG: hypothetical protein OSA43_02570 [Pirellulales bacterium]|nr:hypothetical protein [Pirellulales bacterium]
MMGTPAIEKDRMAVRRIIAKALAVGGYREHDFSTPDSFFVVLPTIRVDRKLLFE